MRKKTNNTFEILHLVAVLSLRFGKIFVDSDSQPEQIYTLSYLNYYGTTYLKDNKETKIIQREKVVKVIKEVFMCRDDRCTDLFGELKENNFIKDFEVKRQEKTELFTEGRRRVLSITDEGVKKVEQFTRELRLLHDELITLDHNLLFLPQAEQRGVIANNIVLFLKLYDRFKKWIP